MKIKIAHTLSFEYDHEVKLNPHYLHLSPSLSPFQYLKKHDLLISPHPDVLIKNLDQESNIQHLCYVNTPLNRFEVKSVFELISDEFNTLDFIFFPFDCKKIPFKYPAKLSVYVSLALKQKKVSLELKNFSNEIARISDYETISFLINTTATIKKDFIYAQREQGDAQSADFTLGIKSGTCRDFAVLMMEICAAQGLLSRFVSGYFFHDKEAIYDLHAWVEVLLPGGGWRGFDPTEGNVVDHRYVAVAKSLEPKGLVPLRGSYTSIFKVQSVFKSLIEIKEGF